MQSLLRLASSAALLLTMHDATSVKADVITYEWTIKPRLSVPPLSPDCFVDRDMLLVNDEFPGPEIKANIGDTVHIKWINMHPSEGVSIHYHGNLMLGQPYSDGTGGVSTCVVGPMQTFEHKFVADNAGTHYWHGHTSLDRMDGLQGLLIISDPDDPQEQALKDMYDEERVVFLQDWWHKSGPNLRTSLDSGVWIGSPQSILVNGKGRFDACLEDPTLPQCDEDGCTAENYIAPIPVEAEKTYLFRIINAASLMSLNFAIADHNMTVVRADGVYVEPFEVSSLEINVAQRYSVLVTTNQAPDISYWATADAGRGLMGKSYLQYGDSAPPNENYTMPGHAEDGPYVDAMLASKDINAQHDPDILGEDVARSAVIVTAQALYPPSGIALWTSNNVSTSMHAPKPLITLAYDAVNSIDAATWPATEIPGTVEIPDYAPVTWNFSMTPMEAGINTVHEDHGLAVFKFVKGDVVEMVFQNTVGSRGSASSHAWHLHGHQLYIIGQGTGIFDPETDPANYNLENPVLRDTFSVWNLGWTAIRFRANNPGVWPFHCTMTPHAVQGMGFNVITSPDELSPPPPGLESCYQTSVNPEDAQVCTLRSEMTEDGDIIESSADTSINRSGESSSEKGTSDKVVNSAGSVEAGHNLALLAMATILVAAMKPLLL